VLDLTLGWCYIWGYCLIGVWCLQIESVNLERLCQYGGSGVVST